MSALKPILLRAALDLDSVGAAWAVIGGLAVSARAEPRMTRDVDVAVAVTSDVEAENIAFAMSQLGYSVGSQVEQTGTGRLATVRFIAPVASGRRVFVDLLFASSGIEPELVAAADRIEIVRGVTMPVARSGHLIALKLLARDDRERPQDLDDLKALLAVADDTERSRARDAVRLIAARGFARGRDLAAALEALLSR